MAQIGKRKGSIIKGRSMPVFKQKQTSAFGKITKSVKSTAESVRRGATRTISKAATHEERKKVARVVHKAVTSKEAKSVGKGIMGFLRTWGASAQAAYEREHGKRR